MIAGAVNLGYHQLKLMATNAVHSASAVNKSDVAELTIANGYTGPVPVTVTSTGISGSSYQLVLANPASWTLTASTSIRGLVLYCDTGGSLPLICRWNLAADGTSVTLNNKVLGIQFASPALTIS